MAGLCLWSLCLTLSAASPGRSLWTTNGLVNTLASHEQTLFIGGTFSYVGPPTGNLVSVSKSTADLADFPSFKGPIFAMISDAAGGWYVGGNFSEVNGSARAYLVRVLADGSIDANFSPAANAPVRALLKSAGNLYVGGDFTSIGGSNRNRLAVIDANTGTAGSWNPNAGGAVHCLLLNGTTLYVGGDFPSLNGTTRNRLAAYDTATGVLTAWNPNLNSSVYSLALTGTTLYAGGNFTTVNGNVSRWRLAAFNTGLNTGNVTGWNPAANGGVKKLLLRGNTLYVAGQFTSLSAQTRNRTAAYDISNGNLLAWHADADAEVTDLHDDGSWIYLGGNFTQLGGQQRLRLAAVDPASAALQAWNLAIGGAVMSLAGDGDHIYVGGNFSSAGGVPRERLAAIDIATGVPTDWAPTVANSASPTVTRILKLHVAENTLYVGGTFTHLDGSARNYLGAYDLASLTLTAFDPQVSGGIFQPGVRSLLVDGDTLYLGGQFEAVGGEPRYMLAAVDLQTSLPLPWAPDLTSSLSGQIFHGVNALAKRGDTIYAGGNFDRVGGDVRHNLAAIAPNGAATAWTPNVSSGNEYFTNINAMLVDDDQICIGGMFTAVNGIARNHLACIDNDGQATAWDPYVTTTGSLFDGILALHRIGGTVFAAGAFTAIGNDARNYLAAVDAETGLATAWMPNAQSVARDMIMSGDELFVGHNGQQTQATVTEHRYTPPTTTASPAPGIYQAAISVVLTCDDASTTGCAAIHYTLDSSAPDRSSPVYTAPINLTTNTRLRFFARDNAGFEETAQTHDYTIDDTAPQTSSSVQAGIYTETQSVALSCQDDNSGCAEIYYTLNGSDPDTDSTRYIGPFSIAANATLKFFSIDLAGNREPYQQMAFTVDGIAPQTAASETTGIFDRDLQISLSCGDDNSGCAATHYTLDGSLPSTASAIYSGPLDIATNTTLRFFSVDNAGNAEPVREENYVIDKIAPSADSTLAAGLYTGAQTTVLSCSDDNSGCAGIYFTLDGSEPAIDANRYNAALSINHSCVLKYFVMDAAGNRSAVQTLAYTINTAPSAEDRQIPMPKGRILSATLSAMDLDGDSLSYQVLTRPTQGNLLITSSRTGTYVYFPGRDAHGQDQFTYQVSDGHAVSNIATVTINLDAPRTDNGGSNRQGGGGGCSASRHASAPQLPVHWLAVCAYSALRLRRKH